MRRLALLLILSLFAVPGLTIARVQREQLIPELARPSEKNTKPFKMQKSGAILI